MALRFAISPEHCARFHDALTCLSKFSDLLSIEARYGQLLLSALNISKSAYAFFVFDKDEFFHSYEFDSGLSRRNDRFSCCILNKAIASVFKGRLGDAKTGEGAIERCEAVFEDRPTGEECRLVIKLMYRQGVTKTFKLTYEAADMMQAVFDKRRASNKWKASARMLKEFADHFGNKTEQLDICSEEGQVTFTSYTEKVTQGKETLKQPLQTSVTIETSDFDHFNVQDDLHINISVKDFRSIVTHAVTFGVSISALYSLPSHPLQLSYSKDGMSCEFTLMTVGESRGMASSITRSVTREPSARPSNVADESRRSARSELPQLVNKQRKDGKLGRRQVDVPAPPPQNAGQAGTESLFVPEAEDDDRRWDPPMERPEDDIMLGWDASVNNDASFHNTFTNNNARPVGDTTDAASEVVAPTQRASQIRGLFD